MEIRRNRVVVLDYTLKDDAGSVIDRSGKQPLYYLHGYANIVPGLEEALEGHAAGETLSVSIPPEKGYGVRDANLISKIPISRLPEGSSPMRGQRYSIQMGNQTRMVTVTKVLINDIEIDANHMLADKTLHFEVRVRQVRDATRGEIEHRHAHPPDSHH